ncbi:MAG: hypothetical protein ACOCX0_05190, partial [Bacteroidota bacterium]
MISLKNIFKVMSLVAVSLLLANCNTEEQDIPPIETLSPDSIITLAELRAMITSGQTYRFENSGKQVFAVVTMDEKNGNIYRQAYI